MTWERSGNIPENFLFFLSLSLVALLSSDTAKFVIRLMVAEVFLG